MAAQWPLRILLTEDNTVNQRLALLILERLGYRADVAGNGLEALDALQRQTYDVILMDVQMPEMDGLEATRRIRMTLPETSQPYIIAMTANAMQGDRETCLAAGMNNYVSKPINVSELVEALKQAHTQTAASAPPTVAADAPLDSVVTPDLGEPDTSAQTNGASETRPEDVSGVIDPGAIKRLRSALGQQADAMLPGLIDAFFTDSDRLQNQAREALAAGKLDELHRAAHSLKSNSANFGATTMTELCRTLEQQAHAETLEGTEDLLAQIGRAYEQARFALEQVRKEMCNE
jgi:CheY-like chemotaxis protein/HPt (histidine-containing phosphotransfer) domain-containing protein